MAGKQGGALMPFFGVDKDTLRDYVQDQSDKAKAKSIAATNAAKKTNDQLPAPKAQVLSLDRDLQAAYPNLTASQRAIFKKDLGDNPSLADYQKIQDRAEKQSDRNLTLSQAQASKDEARIAKGEKPVVGLTPDGKQVLVPAGDVSKYGLTQVREVGQAENEKVTNARSLTTVFDNSDEDDLGLLQLAKKLDSEGKLGPVATRFQDTLNRGGSVLTFDAAGDPDVQRLFTKLGLSTTGLMQVHVGARGSAQMLEHFEDLAKAKSMSPQAFIAALDTENKYVRMKAMFPPSEKATASKKTGSATTTPSSTFNPNALPKAN
jgi:hypothetical protein